jgi:hypothetical protein
MERAHIERAGGNPAATLSVFVGALGLLAAPIGLLVAQESEAVTLRWGIAGGGVAAVLIGVVALVLARRGRLRADRSITAAGRGAASVGRLLGTLAICVGIAAAIALGTDAALTHFQE